MNNDYMKQYMKNRRLQRRITLLELSGNICSICSSSENLEFNHIDRTSKLFVLSGKGLDKQWQDVLAEHKKCELLCKNCHLDRTRQQYSNGEIRSWNDRKNIPYEHGTSRMYHEMKCRCESCKLAKSMYRKKQISNTEKII